MDPNLGQVVLVKDINPGVFNGSNQPVYYESGDRVLADEPVENKASRSDFIPRPYYPSSLIFNNSYPQSLIEFSDRLYFSADDGVNGRELYISDGTAGGTQLVADINPGEDKYGNPRSSYASNLLEFNDKIYFTANNGKNGNELYVSDGTADGTQLVVDINPGEDNYGNPRSSYAGNLLEFNDKIYFTANNGENGNELYVSDGTADGTQLVADINPGEDNYGNPRSSDPSNLTVVGNELFFTANNGDSGNELFKLTFDDVIEPALMEIKGSNNADNLLGSNNAEDIKALGGEDNVTSGSGDDTVDGGNGDDRLMGNNGNDQLIGGNGNDTLSGDEGDDMLFGKKGSDVLEAGSGDDLLEGNFNADTLNGGNGDDRLVGGSGDDLLEGGNGNDRFDGSVGLDTLKGGNGEDVFVLRTDAGMDTIQNFDLESDRLSLDFRLQFADLSFDGNQILKGEEVLATLDGINTEQLTEINFSQI